MKDYSLIKTLTWRVVATTDTFLISWLLTGNPLVGFSIASLEVLTKMFLYYAHEKAWLKYINRKGKSNGYISKIKQRIRKLRAVLSR